MVNKMAIGPTRQFEASEQVDGEGGWVLFEVGCDS